MNAPPPRILGVVPRGSGAAVVHATLGRGIPGYLVQTYSPSWEFCPPMLRRYCDRSAAVVHAPPDHSVFLCPRETPLVVTFHNFVLDRPIRAQSTLIQRIHYATDLRFFTRLALRRATVVTAVSTSTADLIRRHMNYTRPIVVVPNGVDSFRFRPSESFLTQGPLRVLFSGNLSRRKGAHLLPQIARLAGPDIEIYYTAGARAGISDPGWTDLTPVGRVPYADMPALYHRFHALLLPSIREGLSLSLLEAMASGLAIVASDIPSNAEPVVNGVGGLLCPADDPKAYAAALRTLARDRDRARAMGLHNRMVVEQRYTQSRMLDGYREVFRRILERSE